MHLQSFKKLKLNILTIYKSYIKKQKIKQTVNQHRSWQTSIKINQLKFKKNNISRPLKRIKLGPTNKD